MIAITSNCFHASLSSKKFLLSSHYYLLLIPLLLRLLLLLLSLSPSGVQTALDNFPEISVVTELKKDGETPAFKVRLSGKAYNKKTMKPCKTPHKAPQVRRDPSAPCCIASLFPVEGSVSRFIYFSTTSQDYFIALIVFSRLSCSLLTDWSLKLWNSCSSALFPLSAGVHGGSAENSVVLSVSLPAALQVSHVPHVQGRGKTPICLCSVASKPEWM